MRRRLNPREIMLLVVLIVLVLGSAYYLLFYTPTRNEIDSLERSIVDTEDTIEAERLRVAERDRMKAELDEIFANDPDPVSMAPYDNSRNVMHELHSILAEAQDYSLNFAPATTSENGDVVRRNVSLNFTCPGYSSAKEVLQKLHDSQYRCLLSNLSVAMRERSRTGGWWYNFLMGSVDSRPDTEEASDELSEISVSATLTFFEYVDETTDAAQGLESVEWVAPDSAYEGPEIPTVEADFTGWTQNKDGLYFYFRDGAMVTNEWITGRYGQYYYVQLNGVLATGFQYVSNPSGSGFFYFAPEGDVGCMLTGWQQISPDNYGWFETTHNGHFGCCTYTDAWGQFKNYLPAL